MNILLTNNRIKNFTGSEIDTVTIANYFISLNYNVDIFTLEYSEPLINNLDKKVRIICYKTADLLLSDYDLIWSHHFPLLDYVLFTKKVKTKYINYSCLSSFEPYEMMPIYYKRLSNITYLSNETKEYFKNQKIDMHNFSFFPNYVYDRYFDNEKNIEGLKRICIVSNHIPKELIEAKELLEDNKYIVDIYGSGYNETMVDSNLLNKYDLVITIGKTVNYALGLGIPVFCYDHFGGDLYITKKNIKDSFNYNFSGRYKKIKLSATEIYNYIIANYNLAVKSIKYNKKFIKENCSFENNIDKLLKKIFNLPQIDCDSLYLNYSILKYYGELFVREISNGTIIINDLKDINSKLNAANNDLNNINTKLLKVCNERLELINNLRKDKK